MMLNVLPFIALASAAVPLDARISALEKTIADALVKSETPKMHDAPDAFVKEFTNGTFASCKEVHVSKLCENADAKKYCAASCASSNLLASARTNEVHAEKVRR